MLRLVLLIVILVALLLHNLPLLVRDQVVIWLLKNGAEDAQLTTLDVSWFKGRVLVKGLHASTEGKPTLQVDHLLLDLDYSALMDKRLLISELELAGVASGVKLDKEAFLLGPVDLNSFSSEEPSADSDTPTDWSIGLDQLSLSDIDWRAEFEGQAHHFILNQASIAKFYLWAPEQPVQLQLDGALNGAPLSLQSSATPLPQEKHSTIDIKLSDFPVHSVTAIFLPELRAHVDLDLELEVSNHQTTQLTSVDQTGRIELRDIKFRQDKMAVMQQAFQWQGELKLNLKGDQIATLFSNSATSLSGLNIDYAGSVVELDELKLSNELSLKGTQDIEVKNIHLNLQEAKLNQGQRSLVLGQLKLEADASMKNNLDVALSDLKLDTEQLAIEQGGQELSIGTLALRGQAQSPNLQEWNAGLDATLNKVKLSAESEKLIELNKLQLDKLAVADTDKITAHRVELHQLNVQGDGGVFTQWESISLSDIVLAQLQRLSLSEVAMVNSQTRLNLNTERQLQDLDWLIDRLQPEKESQSATSDNKAAKEQGSPFHISIDQFRLTGSNKIEIQDNGVKPAFKTAFVLSELSLDKIDTASSEPSAYQVIAKNNLSTINAKGEIELFSGNYGGHWEAAIKGVELPQVSPYSLEYTGYYLHSGQLSLDTQGHIKDRKLKGDADIRLNKLQVEAQDAGRSGEFDQKVSMPLSTAIMILQDNDDNIDLQIPVDGSLDDPQFGYQTVINKLAGKGLKSAAMGYLSKALQPFGALISIGKMVVDAQEKGSFITLQPVYFSPAGATLNTESEAYLAKLAQMMEERKGMRLNICGLAVVSDKQPIWQQLLEENSKRKKPLTEETLQQELEPRLQQLAQQRSEVVKASMAAKAIDIERLFSCYPKVDLSLQDRPQVSLGL